MPQNLLESFNLILQHRTLNEWHVRRQLILKSLDLFDQITSVGGRRLNKLIDSELYLQCVLTTESEKIFHGLLYLLWSRVQVEALLDNLSEIVSALAECSVQVSKLKGLNIVHISFKAFFDLELGSLSGKPKTAIYTLLIFNFFGLASEAKGCQAKARDKETTIDEFDRCTALRTLFVTFSMKYPLESFILRLLEGLVFFTGYDIVMRFGLTNSAY